MAFTVLQWYATCFACLVTGIILGKLFSAIQYALMFPKAKDHLTAFRLYKEEKKDNSKVTLAEPTKTN